MTRKIVSINDELCNGCGLCATACHEAAIEIIDGKARLLRDDYCDGLGACLPACPQNAIVIEEREAAAFNENAGRLNNWPLQLKLVSERAAFLKGADILICADCAAYSHGGFHNDFIKGRVVLIGCPKLDGVDYTEKLAAIFRDNGARSVCSVKMEVPCCTGIEIMTRRAISMSSTQMPHKIVTLSTRGELLEIRDEQDGV
ncbi:MAG: 4Fe-4S binding protein [Spirochaetaceae bacterium]|jgi:NAD-dependent dihydropyrimidine dehydrogenase PreA subunit|nr:4Fe-4S binding protein [Spirochaetaceae bacterium]